MSNVVSELRREIAELHEKQKKAQAKVMEISARIERAEQALRLLTGRTKQAEPRRRSRRPRHSRAHWRQTVLDAFEADRTGRLSRRELVHEVGVPSSSLTLALRKLSDEGRVRETEDYDQGSKVFELVRRAPIGKVPEAPKPAKDKGLVAGEQRPKRRRRQGETMPKGVGRERVHAAIKHVGARGATARELAKALRISHTSATYHARALVAEGKVNRVIRDSPLGRKRATLYRAVNSSGPRENVIHVGEGVREGRLRKAVGQ